jgi:hypothetical protein
MLIVYAPSGRLIAIKIIILYWTGRRLFILVFIYRVVPHPRCCMMRDLMVDFSIVPGVQPAYYT